MPLVEPPRAGSVVAAALRPPGGMPSPRLPGEAPDPRDERADPAGPTREGRSSPAQPPGGDGNRHTTTVPTQPQTPSSSLPDNAHSAASDDGVTSSQDADAVPDGPNRSNGPTEDVLIRRAALGDRSAFTVIVTDHGAGMFRYALRMLEGDHEGAEDAVQEALINAWVNLPGFRGEATLRTWLFRLTATQVLAARRRRRPVAVDDYILSALPEDDHRGPGLEVQHSHLWETLDRALNELPWRQRASWLLREVEGLSYDEIASILETTPTVVRGQLHRARRALAIRMEQWR